MIRKSPQRKRERERESCHSGIFSQINTHTQKEMQHFSTPHHSLLQFKSSVSGQKDLLSFPSLHTSIYSTSSGCSWFLTTCWTNVKHLLLAVAFDKKSTMCHYLIFCVCWGKYGGDYYDVSYPKLQYKLKVFMVKCSDKHRYRFGPQFIKQLEVTF